MTATTATTTAAIDASAPAVESTNATTRCSVRSPRDASEIEAWSRYVARHPYATPFHHPRWSAAVARSFRHTQRDLVAWRDTQVVGVLPLVEINSPLAGRLLVSVPYGNAGGILSDDRQAHDALAEAAMDCVAQRRARQLELRGHVADVPQMTVDEGYYSFVRDLPLKVADVDAFLPRKARAAARQAISREGLTISHAAEHFTTVYDLYTRSMRRLASLNYPRHFFEQLAASFAHDFWVTSVWREHRCIAGVLSIAFRDTIYPYVIGVDERIRCTGATNLVYRAVMERAVGAELRRFDFGRTRRDNPGPLSFKRNQGFEPQPLTFQRFTPSPSSAPNLTPSNPRYRLARRVWPMLPLPLTRWLGRATARWVTG